MSGRALQNKTNQPEAARTKGRGRKQKSTTAETAMLDTATTTPGPSSIPSREEANLQLILERLARFENQASETAAENARLRQLLNQGQGAPIPGDNTMPTNKSNEQGGSQREGARSLGPGCATTNATARHLFDDDIEPNGLDNNNTQPARGQSGSDPVTTGVRSGTDSPANRGPPSSHQVTTNAGRNVSHKEPAQPPGTAQGRESKVPKPKGQPGKDYSIAEKMGLAGSRKKRDRYNALLRSARDLTLNARLPFERAWRDIPAASKATLFAVARDMHPFLSRFENDWATEVIVRQFMKNKRKTLYKAGSLEKPKGYDYLKENSAKRDQSKSRKKTAIVIYEANKEARKSAKEGQRRLRRLARMVVEDEEEGESGEQGDFMEGSSKDGSVDVEMVDEAQGNENNDDDEE
ncbi:hypothetical protein EV421DRAFT_1998158 [Armillaria borealis]|uniref:Uncharacterized protein n=1 Tax=Armillaria borealis TaxID=47425 RepID=A0AA39MG56_9AGAR|nr:hypothetical protein EV421DRAFT_1998158 [Armillaria borealis]